MIRSLLALYSWRIPTTLVYMLQNTEYQTGPYLQWFWRTTHFERIMYRRTLDRTKAARLLLLAVRAGMALEIIASLVLIIGWWYGDWRGGLAFGLALLLAYPILWAHLVVIPLELGRLLIIKPRAAMSIRASRDTFAAFRGPKIAVAGSYGKTSMKELLLTVLSEGKKVAATPANKNVASSHARFAGSLKGDEDILVIEYGESQPGDVARFAATTRPTHAIITGLAPAHLDRYKTVDAVGKDIFAVGEAVPAGHVYVNGESSSVHSFVQSSYHLYSDKGVLGWRVSDAHLALEGTQFTLRRGKDKLELRSHLLGAHQIGPLSLVVALAHEFGLTKQQIEAGIAKTAPFEHRMQPYQLGGAWIIDDTYNGNIEGIRVGLDLLKVLPARRKIYITPGLVDQGKESAKIHREMGGLIAAAKPDMVVLMEHSVTADIQKGLHTAGYKGEVLLENDPLNFYNNLQLFVASGDLVLMQNDWPDNYS